MERLPVRLCLLALAAASGLGLSACGTQKVRVADSDPNHRGAVLFSQRCSGCHTLKAAGAHGSASDIKVRERNDGPNFNVRKEDQMRVMYAIENGGFSGAIMPQNIVVGSDAQAVASFVAKYSGQGARQSSPTQGRPAGARGNSGGKGTKGPPPPPGGTGAPGGGTGGTSGGAGGSH